jgi:hypothetical protein
MGQSAISVVSDQGKTTVHWNGKAVYSGPTQGDVLARKFTVASAEYAIAYDNNVVVWQSHSNAVNLLKSARSSGAPTKVQSQGNLMCQTVEGIARVRWNGKQVYCGSVKNAATVKSKPVGGTVYGAVFDGNQVIWETAPGAANKLK